MDSQKLLLATLLTLSSNLVYAAPSSGWSFNLGYASHTSDVTEFSEEYDSSGLSIGGDYQFAINDSLSINLFLMSSIESTSGNVSVKGGGAGHGVFGVQGRFWSDNLYVGAHLGSYSEVLLDLPYNDNVAGQAFGYGFVAGLENKDGWYAQGQYDIATGVDTWSDTDIDLTALRLSVGYRWK